jgi:beta-N-acetylhexosaminidase
VPAALTPQVSTSLLRGQLHFKGVAISGDLSSGAIEGVYETGDAAIEALKAGIDLVQISEPADQEGVAVAIERAVKAGELPPERLEEAVGRVLKLKRGLGIRG